MFVPNTKCKISLSSGKSDEYGRPILGRKVIEGCTVVKLTLQNQKSSVRADSSASRGNAREIQSNSVILLTKNTKARMDDIIELPNCKLQIMELTPRWDLQGKLDHYEVTAEYWSKA